MSHPRPRLVVIVGPTASGKSALAVRLAKKFNGEVISADSRQIYKGLAIGSGAVTRKEAAGIPHWLVGIAPPRRAFSAAEFRKSAREAIADIARRGKLPFLVGGTAFWADAAAYDMEFPGVPPNTALRKKLAEHSPARLLVMLKRLDPVRAAEIEQKNPRRLIRAIEIAKVIGRVPKLKNCSPYRILWLGLRPFYEVSPRKIETRVRAMIRAGLIAETKGLLRQRVGRKRIREFGFEYRAALEFIEGTLTREQAAGRIIRDTGAYARRQMTWWRRNPEIRWIINQSGAERLVKKFLQKNA